MGPKRIRKEIIKLQSNFLLWWSSKDRKLAWSRGKVFVNLNMNEGLI